MKRTLAENLRLRRVSGDPAAPSQVGFGLAPPPHRRPAAAPLAHHEGWPPRAGGAGREMMAATVFTRVCVLQVPTLLLCMH